MNKLAGLKSLDDDRALVKAACFYVGWMLLSPTSWRYKAIFTNECGEVTLDALITAVNAKNKQLTVSSKEVTIKKIVIAFNGKWQEKNSFSSRPILTLSKRFRQCWLNTH